MLDLSHIPALKRDIYLGGRHARSDNHRRAPSELRGPDLDWWTKGWADRNQELNPEGAVTLEQAAIIRKEQLKAERRAASQKTQVRRKIGTFQDEKELKKLTREVWEE